MDKKKAGNTLKLVAKVIFTILALWLVYSKVDIASLQHIWKNAKGWFFIPAILAFIISQILSAFRILRFFQNINLPIGVQANLRLYLLGMFYNLFLPGGIGGDGYKIVSLKRQYNTTHVNLFRVIFFDRLSGLWALVCLLSLLSLCLPELIQYRWWVLSGFSIATIIYYLATHYFFSKISKRFLGSHILALAVQSFQLIAVTFLLLALGCSTGWLPYYTIFLLSSLASLFPLSVGGLGAREVVIVWGAGTFNLNKDLAVSISLCFYMITVFTALNAIFILFRTGSRAVKSKP